MSKIIREGHDCSPPSGVWYESGTIWECDCKRWWRLDIRLGKKWWIPLSKYEKFMAGRFR